MTDTEVAAEAQATAPDLVVTTEAEIKTLAEHSSGHSPNFFKIPSRMKCKRTFMNKTRDHQKANQHGRSNKVKSISNNKACKEEIQSWVISPSPS